MGEELITKVKPTNASMTLVAVTISKLVGVWFDLGGWEASAKARGSYHSYRQKPTVYQSGAIFIF